MPRQVSQAQIGNVLVGHIDIAGLVGKEELLDALQFLADIGDTDADIVELESRNHAQALRHQKSLAIEESSADIADAIEGITAFGPRPVARQHIDHAGLQRGKTGFSPQRPELDLVRITKNGGGDAAAEIDVKTRPAAFTILLGKTGQWIGR